MAGKEMAVRKFQDQPRRLVLIAGNSLGCHCEHSRHGKLCRDIWGIWGEYITPIIENQMETHMKDEMDTGVSHIRAIVFSACYGNGPCWMNYRF